MRAIKARNLPHRFITNISRSTAVEIRAHMARIGLDPGEDLIVAALDRVGSFLRKNFGSGRVYVLGTDSLKGAVVSGGFEIVGREEEDAADVVLVGLDEDLTYRTLSAAARAVSRGAHFCRHEPRRALAERGRLVLPRRGSHCGLGAGGGGQGAGFFLESPSLFSLKKRFMSWAWRRATPSWWGII